MFAMFVVSSVALSLLTVAALEFSDERADKLR